MSNYPGFSNVMCQTKRMFHGTKFAWMWHGNVLFSLNITVYLKIWVRWVQHKLFFLARDGLKEHTLAVLFIKIKNKSIKQQQTRSDYIMYFDKISDDSIGSLFSNLDMTALPPLDTSMWLFSFRNLFNYIWFISQSRIFKMI